MTRDEARDLLSDAVEGTLPPEQKAELDSLLAEDEELREEMDALRLVIRGAAAIAASDDDEPEQGPDLLGGVQARLRQRSRGRYYRDRFAQGGGASALSPVLLVLIATVLLAVAWVVLQQIVVLDAP